MKTYDNQGLYMKVLQKYDIVTLAAVLLLWTAAGPLQSLKPNKQERNNHEHFNNGSGGGACV